VNTDHYEPVGDVYFDTKNPAQNPKDERINYFLPPIDDATKKNHLMYPTVVSDEMIMTRNGVYPRTANYSKGKIANEYNDFAGKDYD
jgi:hypothetical protein